MAADSGILVLRFVLPIVYGLVGAGYCHAFATKAERPLSWVKPFFVAAMLLHALFLVLLFLESGVFPFGTVARGLLLSSFILAVMIFTFETFLHTTGYSVFILPIHFLFTSAALVFMYQGPWLPARMASYHYVLHVTFMFVAYACFLFSFILSLLYLVQHRGLKKHQPTPLFGRLPALDQMDQTIRLLDALGLSLVLLGIVTGLLWLDAVMGVPSGISVKAGFILLAAVVYMAEHFLRIGKGWNGRRACLMSIVGFLLILCTLLAGRHGY